MKLRAWIVLALIAAAVISLGQPGMDAQSTW
jgi:hypothetical protein